MDLQIIKGADRYRTQIQSHGLQEQVLRGVASLQMHVTRGASFAVFSCGALVHPNDYENGCRLAHAILSQRATIEVGPQVPFRAPEPLMALRVIVEEAAGSPT